MAIVSLLICSPPRGRPCRSPTDPAALDAVVCGLVEPDERMAVRVVEVDGVVGAGRVVALADGLALGVLEGGRRVHRAPYAQGERARVVGQTAHEVGTEGSQVQPGAGVGDERGHTGPAVGPGKGHAIDVGFPDGGEGADRLRDLRGRDVLALPAERVADTVDEIEVAVRVPSHEVPGAKPRVPRLEDAAQDLALGVFLARVPLESPARVRRLLEHLADRLADLVRRAAHAEARLIADG